MKRTLLTAAAFGLVLALFQPTSSHAATDTRMPSRVAIGHSAGSVYATVYVAHRRPDLGWVPSNLSPVRIERQVVACGGWRVVPMTGPAPCVRVWRALGTVVTDRSGQAWFFVVRGGTYRAVRLPGVTVKGAVSPVAVTM